MNIALLGPSGSGKGAQINALGELIGASSIGTGELLRENLRAGAALGILARKYMDAGELVPDELVEAMMEERIRSQKRPLRLIFDGFPRTLYQARFLDQLLAEQGDALDVAVYFQISDEDVMERLTGRTLCSTCHRSYHERSAPPTKEGVCDECGGALMRRPDDVPRLIIKRLQAFRREVGPTLGHYQQSGRLRVIPADASVAEIEEKLAGVARAARELAAFAPTPDFLDRLEIGGRKAPPHDAAAFPSLDLALLGGPGSGKGTLAETLCRRLNLPHIATGDLFRDNLRQKTELGLLAKSFMDRGELVPDDVTEAMVEERLGRADTANGFVLDGFPRSLAQAEALTEMLEGQRRRMSAVISINVSDDAIIERLSNRLICRECQAPFHRIFKPPRTEGRCDVCGGELYQRDDDNPETVSSRLKIFHAQSEPLIRYYREAGLLKELGGEAKPEEVQAAAMKAVLRLK